MRPLNVIVHHWDHNNGIENKVCVFWGGGRGGGTLGSEPAAFQDTLLFKISKNKKKKSVTVQKNNALTHPGGLPLNKQYVIFFIFFFQYILHWKLNNS